MLNDKNEESMIIRIERKWKKENYTIGNVYVKGVGEEQRKEADTNLFLNMQKISSRQSRNPYALTWFTLIALLYYISTRLFGRYYFNYDTPHHS